MRDTPSSSLVRPAPARLLRGFAEVFDHEVDPACRIELFDLIGLTPNLNLLLLTKRLGNVTRMLK